MNYDIVKLEAETAEKLLNELSDLTKKDTNNINILKLEVPNNETSNYVLEYIRK